MMDIEKRIAFFNEVALIVPISGSLDDEETMRVDFVDPEEKALYATGEETGEQIYFDLAEIDMNEYIFYQFVSVSPKSILGVENI